MPESLFSLTDKVVVVTGAASGIGAGIAEVLAEAGALAVVADAAAGAARGRADELVAAGLRADWVAVDLTDEASVVAACEDIVKRHGAPWALVNNAGIQDREYLLEETVEGWDRAQAVNARGAFLITRELGRAMTSTGRGGRIVNIASASLVGQMVKGSTAYVASKGALAAFSSALALELAPHEITVNTVLPGAVVTPGAIEAKGPPTEGPGTRRAPLGMSEPRDIGSAVLYFTTPAARYVSNQTIAVDAGFSIS